MRADFESGDTVVVDGWVLARAEARAAATPRAGVRRRAVLIRADELTSGTVLSADVCVIGAGAAGITLALELMESGLEVLVLESGDTEPIRRPSRCTRGRASASLS